MVIQTGEKWHIKFDEQEKQYIYYRIMTKSEMEAHLAAAHIQENSVQNAIAQFQTYIDDPRVEVIEPIEEVIPK